MRACGGQRKPLGVIFRMPSTSFWDRSLIDLELAVSLEWLSSETWRCPSTQHQDYRCVPSYSSICMWVLGIKFRFLCFWGTYYMSCLSSPESGDFWWTLWLPWTLLGSDGEYRWSGFIRSLLPYAMVIAEDALGSRMLAWCWGEWKRQKRIKGKHVPCWGPASGKPQWALLWKM